MTLQCLRFKPTQWITVTVLSVCLYSLLMNKSTVSYQCMWPTNLVWYPSIDISRQLMHSCPVVIKVSTWMIIKTKIVKGKYEPQLEFPEWWGWGQGVQAPKPSIGWGSIDIFWDMIMKFFLVKRSTWSPARLFIKPMFIFDILFGFVFRPPKWTQFRAWTGS